MACFLYRAARPTGHIIEDRAEGDSEAAVRSQLEAQGLFLFSVRAQESTRRIAVIPTTRARLTLRDFLIFNQEFAALIKAGLPVLRVFDLLAERTAHGSFQYSLRGVREEIRGGRSMSEAMSRFPHHFSDLYRASLKAGEQTGNVSDMLARYIVYLKRVIEVREKVVKALAYPLFLIVVGMAVVIFLITYVIPSFAEIYGQSRNALPGPTLALLTLVDWIASWWLGLSLLIGALAGALYGGARTTTGREQLAAVALRLPLIGDVLLKGEVVRMARTLSTILAGGIPLLAALHITRDATTNPVMAKAIDATARQVRDGVSLSAALGLHELFPRMTLEMIAVGETTGSLEIMLQEVAEFHEGELDLSLNQMTTWIEPVLLLLMGLIVGSIVIVMYLPIFQLAGTV